MTTRYDVIVIGAGPAGLRAATATAAAGARTLLLDENGRAGGQLRYRLIEVRDEVAGSVLAPLLAERLVERAVAAGVEVELDARVWGLFAQGQVAVERGGESSALHAERIVLSTGSIDRTVTFPGGSLPGVFTARAIQLLLHRDCVLPGRRFAIVGDGAEAKELARDIELAGGDVVASASPEDDFSARGNTGITGIVSGGRELEVDVVVVAAGRLPDASLAMMAGCEAGRTAASELVAPAVDERMETSVPALFLAGDCAGPCSVQVALAEGAYAGTSVVASLGLISLEALEPAQRAYRNATGDRAAELAGRARLFTQVYRAPVGAIGK